MCGCSEISAETINQKEKEVVAACMTYVPGETVRIIRTDSLSANKSKERAAALADMLIHAQFSPPGQHSYIGDVKKWFYPLVKGAAILLRSRPAAPRSAWYSACEYQLDCMWTEAQRLHSSDSTAVTRDQDSNEPAKVNQMSRIVQSSSRRAGFSSMRGR
jgi:hypothetical protein